MEVMMLRCKCDGGRIPNIRWVIMGRFIFYRGGADLYLNNQIKSLAGSSACFAGNQRLAQMDKWLGWIGLGWYPMVCSSP